MASPRKSLLEFRKKSQQITYAFIQPSLFFSYLDDGRRLKDGHLVAPTSPKGLWRDFFLRSFVRRIGYDLENSSEVTSVDTVIDIIDYSPLIKEPSSDSDSTDSLDPTGKYPLPSIEFDDSQPGQFNLSMRSRLSRTNSGVLSEARLQPILLPCCPSCKLKPKESFINVLF